MGQIYSSRPQFLAMHANDMKFQKLMFIKKNGTATHQLGNLTRDTYDAELICVSNEDEENWIGNYAEGFGLFGVRFNKADCREATDEEVEAWIKDRDSIKF